MLDKELIALAEESQIDTGPFKAARARMWLSLFSFLQGFAVGFVIVALTWSLHA